MVSKEMLKRLLSELKRLKKIEHKQEEREENPKVRQLLIEPLHQDLNEEDEREYNSDLNENKEIRELLIEPLQQQELNDEEERQNDRVLLIEPLDPDSVVDNSKRVLLIEPYNPNEQLMKRTQTELLIEPLIPNKEHEQTNLKYLETKRDYNYNLSLLDNLKKRSI